MTLSYTHIVAPVDGHVTQRTGITGNYVAPGQDLMVIVPAIVGDGEFQKPSSLWCTLASQCRSRLTPAPGRISAAISSPSSAAPAAGILPPENATGNYVKVVQRVPVKIVIDQVPKIACWAPA